MSQCAALLDSTFYLQLPRKTLPTLSISNSCFARAWPPTIWGTGSPLRPRLPLRRAIRE